MANYSESYLALIFIMSTLKADATLASLAPGGVYRELLPPNTTPPYVIVGQQSGSDYLTANAFRIFDTFLFRVEAHGMAAQADTTAQAGAQIDRLLGGPPGLPTSGPIYVNSVFAGFCLSCYREQPLQLDETINTTEEWTRFGGLYRLLIQQSAS